LRSYDNNLPTISSWSKFFWPWSKNIFPFSPKCWKALQIRAVRWLLLFPPARRPGPSKRIKPIIFGRAFFPKLFLPPHRNFGQAPTPPPPSFSAQSGKTLLAQLTVFVCFVRWKAGHTRPPAKFSVAVRFKSCLCSTYLPMRFFLCAAESRRWRRRRLLAAERHPGSSQPGKQEFCCCCFGIRMVIGKQSKAVFSEDEAEAGRRCSNRQSICGRNKFGSD
jgi:hypothetical protein